jgi:hypothetical protein
MIDETKLPDPNAVPPAPTTPVVEWTPVTSTTAGETTTPVTIAQEPVQVIVPQVSQTEPQTVPPVVK